MAKKAKLTPKEFVLRAYEKLRDPKYKGLHVVYSGFNEAFREYYRDEGLDVREVIDELVKEEFIKKAPARGGIKIYLPKDAPATHREKGASLKKMDLD